MLSFNLLNFNVLLFPHKHGILLLAQIFREHLLCRQCCYDLRVASCQRHDFINWSVFKAQVDKSALERKCMGTTSCFSHISHGKVKQASLPGVRSSESDMCGPTIPSSELWHYLLLLQGQSSGCMSSYNAWTGTEIFRSLTAISLSLDALFHYYLSLQHRLSPGFYIWLLSQKKIVSDQGLWSLEIPCWLKWETQHMLLLDVL